MLFTCMFSNLLSLYLHFQILNFIDEKYSVRDVHIILSKKMHITGRNEIMSDIPKEVKDLVSNLKIDQDILRKSWLFYWKTIQL